MDKSLLEKYFEGRCNPAELREVLKWLTDDGQDPALLEEVMSAGWEEIHSESYIKRRWWLWAAAAAVVVLVVGASLLYRPVRPVPATTWVTVTNQDTHIEYTLLPDGTKVWLDPNSSVSYDRGRDSLRRLVRLNGQAFFDVARDDVHPFVVYGGGLSVRVLGTAFNMEAYDGEPSTRVSLVRGKVAVTVMANPAARPQVLTNGELLNFMPGTGLVTREALRELTMSDWTGGHLVFNDVPVQVALGRLCRLYGLRLSCAGNVHLDKYRFSTVFDGESRDQMIRNILFITGYTYRLQGDTLAIGGKK